MYYSLSIIVARYHDHANFQLTGYKHGAFQSHSWMHLSNGRKGEGSAQSLLQVLLLGRPGK